MDANAKLRLKIRIAHKMALARALDLVYTMHIDEDWMDKWAIPLHTLDQAIEYVADAKFQEGVTAHELREAWKELQD